MVRCGSEERIRLVNYDLVVCSRHANDMAGRGHGTGNLRARLMEVAALESGREDGADVQLRRCIA